MFTAVATMMISAANTLIQAAFPSANVEAA